MLVCIDHHTLYAASYALALHAVHQNVAPVSRVLLCAARRPPSDLCLRRHLGIQEVLFAPLSGISLEGEELVDTVRVLKARLNINLKAQTLEEVESKMLTSHLGLIDLLTENFRFAGVPESEFVSLVHLREEVSLRPKEEFNMPVTYKAATEKALKKQEDVFDGLISREVWQQARRDTRASGHSDGCQAARSDTTSTPSPAGEHEHSMRKTAALAARTGKFSCAIKLLKMSLERVTNAVSTELIELLGAEDARRSKEVENTVREAGSAIPDRWVLDVALWIFDEGVSPSWAEVLLELMKDASAEMLDAFGKMLKRHRLLTERLKKDSKVLWLREGEKPKGGRAPATLFAFKGGTLLSITSNATQGVKSECEVRLGGATHKVSSSELFIAGNDGAGAMLRAAAKAGCVQFAEMLLDSGVPINEPDIFWNTAIIVAARHKQEEMLWFLRQKEADAHLYVRPLRSEPTPYGTVPT